MRYAIRQLFLAYTLKGTNGENYRTDFGKILDTVKCNFHCLLLTLIHILGFNMVSRLFTVVTTKKLALMTKVIAVAIDQHKV